MTNPVTITIHGSYSVINGPFPKKKFDEVTSYEVEGYQYSPLFRKGAWDGRKRLASSRTGSFPTGLLDAVKKCCSENGVEYVVVDKRVHPGRMDVYGTPSLELSPPWKLRDYQKRCVLSAVQCEKGVLNMATGSGKSVCAVGIVHALQVRSLVLVPSRELLHQLRDTFLSALPGATEETVGIVGDNEWLPGSFVTIATVSTLHARFEDDACQDLLKSAECLIGDEVHGGGSDSYYDVAMACNAYFRFGFSGTAWDRTDGGSMRLVAAFGEEIASVRYKELVDAGVLPRAKIIFDKIVKPTINLKADPKPKGPGRPPAKKNPYPEIYKQGVVENAILMEKVVEWTKICVDQGLSVLILVDQISHGKAVDDALWNVEGKLIPHSFIHGDSKDRDEVIDDFKQRNIPVMIGSSILDVGISIDSIDVLICAGSRKSKIKTIQRLGRALRGEKAIVIEFFSFCHSILLAHSQKRFKDYKAEDCFILKQSSPNADLIRRLWND